MSNADDRNELEVSLTVMESEALNFAYRFINDGSVRIGYINQAKMLAQEYRKKVTSGAMQPKEAALQVYELRNQIMEAQRLRTSDIGRAKAVHLKHAGLACGPGAPVCSVMGVFIGGALGAMGADFTFGWVF